jgi:hypothetical protein
MRSRPARRPWLLAIPLAAALAAGAGCDDRFRSADSSPPRIVEIILGDPEGTLPAREVIPDGDDIRVADVPLPFSRIRVRFSKVMDGSTIQKSPNPALNGTEPAGNLLPLGCEPAENVQVTESGGAGAASFTASVCYDPTGPDMIVEPAVATCGGLVPAAAYRSASASSTEGGFPALERGATYTVRAAAVKDHQGNAISFTLTVATSTALALASDPGDPTFQPVVVATEYGGGQVTGQAPLDPASTLTGVPPGPPTDPSTGAPTPPTVNEETGFTAFGPDLLLRFDAPLCAPRGDAPDLPELPGYCAPMGVDTGSLFGVRLAIGAEELGTVSGAQASALHFPFSGGYEAVSDRYLAGADAGALHLVPWLPLEDGATYALTLDGGLHDVTGAPLGATSAFSFQAAPGDFRVQVVQPPDGATGVPPTTDLLHHASVATGHGIEFVASRPLAVDGAGRPLGTIELHEGDASGPLAQFAGTSLGADVAALDTRGRWFAIGARTGQGDLALKPGQQYTVVLKGLASAADPSLTIPSFQWSFTTAPFSRDPALSVPVAASAIAAADPVPGAAGEVRGAFLVQYVSGKVKHDGAASPAVAPQAGGEELFPLLGAAGGPPASISLAKARDAAGQACSTGCEVAGISGYVKTTSGLDLFANGAGDDPDPNLRSADLAAAKPRAGLPRSAIGFLPDAPLEPGAAYVLTLANVVDVNDAPLAGADGAQPANGQLAIPFTVRPFAVRRVLSKAALDAGAAGQALESGARFVAVDGANPLTVELRASPDVPAAGATTAGDPANDPVALVDLQTGKGVPVTIAPDPASTLRLTVKPATALAPGRSYTLLVTSKLFSRAEAPGSGVAAAPFSLAFTTPDAKDAGGNLVCE